MTRTEVEALIDKVVDAERRATCRRIDAGACQTTYDYQRARDAEDAASEMRDEVVNALCAALRC